MMKINERIKADILNVLHRCDIHTLCNEYFANEFLWVIKGSSLISGTYTDKHIFLRDAIARLSSKLANNWVLHILDSYVDGNTLIVEMKGEVKTLKGGDYDNEYCWIMTFNDDMKITKLTAYYDSLLVDKTLTEQN